ncbi:hypothetical protein J4E81_010200 [Alternaria sp. BMP 2799]|nr:hypothetical protein J4E81_010200 [Alternaria sp. BMP 2799]
MSSKIENPWDDIHQLKHRWITGLKLLLDSSIDTSELEKKLDDLQRDGFIHAQDDAFTDYLVQSLTRVREKQFDEGFQHPEFVICAPIAWSVKSYHRWYSSFVSAIRIVWPEHDAQTPPRITTASEPEAAASYCLSNWGGDFEVDDCVLNVDAGGGTIQLTTLKKTRQNPDRWELVCEMSCKTCGGESWNNNVRRILERKFACLEEEGVLGQLLQSNDSVSNIIESAVQFFESDIKRSCPDLTTRDPDPNERPPGFRIYGLQPDQARNFERNELFLTPEEYDEVVGGSLTGLDALFHEQYQHIEAKGGTVSCVTWTGQFSDSRLLRDRGKECTQNWPHPPKHIHDKAISSFAVAGGAGIRALNVDMFPPSRLLRASFAVTRTVPKQWGSAQVTLEYPKLAHLGGLSAKRGLDGKFYYFNLLHYFAQKGEEFSPDQEFFITSKHIFQASDCWIARESIWYTEDGPKESWHAVDGDENAGVAELGVIEYDMDSLKGKIGTEQLPGCKRKGEKVYEITLRVGIEMLEDYRHTLRVQARWAPELNDDDNDSSERLEGDEGMDMHGQDFNISAAFELSAI